MLYNSAHMNFGNESQAGERRTHRAGIKPRARASYRCRADKINASEEHVSIQDLEERLLVQTDLLYRISCGILRRPQEREDAVQSAMEIAFRKAHTVRDESRLRSWLVRVMINECYALLRRSRREVPVAALPEEGVADDVSADALALRDALQQLPEAQRLPLILHYLKGSR